MPSNTMESARGGREEAKAAENGKGEAKADQAPAKGGGLKPWLPLIIAVVTMPALAFATTHFILLPKIERAMGGGKIPQPPARVR